MMRRWMRAADGTLTSTTDIGTWQAWAVETGDENTVIAQDKLEARDPRTKAMVKFEISTVFLSIDHNRDPYGRGVPVLFETMIFSSENRQQVNSEFQYRYTNEADARRGHALALELLKNGTAPERLQLMPAQKALP